jgi:hypothetical protein
MCYRTNKQKTLTDSYISQHYEFTEIVNHQGCKALVPSRNKEIYYVELFVVF